jgi:hypothetical protein
MFRFGTVVFPVADVKVIPSPETPVTVAWRSSGAFHLASAAESGAALSGSSAPHTMNRSFRGLLMIHV